MEPNLIRSIIFLIGGLVSIIFARQIYELKFNPKIYLAKKFNIKNKWFNSEYEEKHAINVLRIFGIIFLIISLALFLYAISVKY